MAATESKPKIKPKHPKCEDDLDHVVCGCDENLSLCGLDVSGMNWGFLLTHKTCIVCMEMTRRPCERCGDNHGNE